MSHFSKVQTSINNILLLKESLLNLGFRCDDQNKCIYDSSGQSHDVVLIATCNSFKSRESIVGFFWDQDHYDIIVDLDYWNKGSSFNFFVEQLHQNYALNMILQQTEMEGFQKIAQNNLVDGSVKLTVQRWI
uniref:Uncharacterized protein ycf35 n=1 Tax=Centroceras clavulatum TaxID=159503 RepID=A0A4D6WPP8_9FLOR|nr:hypothetical protein [Centroceras clavulatum]